MHFSTRPCRFEKNRKKIGSIYFSKQNALLVPSDTATHFSGVSGAFVRRYGVSGTALSVAESSNDVTFTPHSNLDLLAAGKIPANTTVDGGNLEITDYGITRTDSAGSEIMIDSTGHIKLLTSSGSYTHFTGDLLL